VPSKSAAGGTVEDATYGIVGFSRNNATGDPMVRYIASFDPNESVDLCWGVCDQTSWSKIQGGSTQTMTAGLPWLNVQRPLETASQADATTSRIKFKFNHALAQLNVQIDTDADVTTHSDGDAPDTLGAATKVYVRSISFTGVALKGALNLNNTTPNEALWLDWCGCTDLSYGQSVTVLDGRRDSREGVSGAEAANETPQGLNSAIVQNSYTTLGVTNKLQNLFEPYATHAPAVTGQPTDAEITAGLGDAVMVIPTGEAMTVTIVYDIETANPKLASYLSDGVTHGVSIENKVTQTVSFGGGYGAGLESNKRYTLKLHLGMNSVKFDADVSDWASSTVDGDAWLPSNTRPIVLNHSLLYISSNTTLTATTDPIGQAITWTNSDDGVASFTGSGPYPSPRRAQQTIADTYALTSVTLKPVANGVTTVTAELASGDKATCEVHVVPVTMKSDNVTTPAKTITDNLTKDGTLTLTADAFNADGSSPTINWSFTPAGSGITLSATSGTTTTVTGLAAGTYTITATNASYTDDPATCTLTVTSQTPTYTPPTANSLTYNGTSGDNGGAQDLITGGSVTGGTGAKMQYTLGTSSAPTGSYADALPSQTNAGTYYVWYKVVGGSGYTDVADLGPVAVTINKKTPTVSLSASSGTGFAKGEPSTFTATTDGASPLTVSSTNGTATISSGIVTAQGSTAGTATVTVSSAASANYNAASATYSLTVNAKTASMNPLYYVDTQNVSSSYGAVGVTPYYANGTGSNTYGDLYTYSQLSSISVNGYHVPTQAEWLGIVPALWNTTAGAGQAMLPNYTTGSNPTVSVAVGGSTGTVPDESVWYNDWSSNKTMYAVRFIGTDRCSLWKYQYVSGTGLTVSSMLIDYIATASDAQTWLNSHYNDTMTGVTSTVAFGACGYRNPSNGSFDDGGTEGDYWSSDTGGYGAWFMGFDGSYIYVRSGGTGYGCSVRLFRD